MLKLNNRRIPDPPHNLPPLNLLLNPNLTPRITFHSTHLELFLPSLLPHTGRLVLVRLALSPVLVRAVQVSTAEETTMTGGAGNQKTGQRRNIQSPDASHGCSSIQSLVDGLSIIWRQKRAIGDSLRMF